MHGRRDAPPRLRVAVAIASCILLLPASPAFAAWLSKAVAHVATERNVRRAFGHTPEITGWEVDPISTCERLGPTRVNCEWELFTTAETVCPGTAHVHLVHGGVYTFLTFDLPEPNVCE